MGKKRQRDNQCRYNTTKKTKDWATWGSLKPGVDIGVHAPQVAPVELLL